MSAFTSAPSLARALRQGASALGLFAATALAPVSAQTVSATHIPTGEPFTGKIALERAASVPAFPAPVQAPKGAPNVLLVLLDDAGFAATSTFGGAARTPNLDALAANGVRYNRFHTTAICSPTRAALLTGRNHHQVGFGNLQDVPAGFPAYNTIWKQETASIARILQQNGYSTAAFGKWHNTPRWEATSVGPFNHWPTGLGFDHFYGFMAGEDNQWEPNLYDDTRRIDGKDRPADYHLTHDLVEKAIGWVDDHAAVASTKPYFLYMATGAVHAPHHVPQEWIDRNKGRFDGGWDKYREETFARQKRLGIIPANAKLTPRPEGLPAWDSLTPEQKRLYAHEMEVYSAFVEQTDAEVGRLIDTLRKKPGGDNLMVIYIVGDNGGSAEGGLDGLVTNEPAFSAGAKNDFATVNAAYAKLGSDEVDNHYSAGWAWATTTPFQWMKQVASHFGGTRNPLIVSWPGHTAAPEKVRAQFGHVNDIAPTILDAAKIAFPDSIDGVKQIPFEGTSLLPSLTNPAAAEAHKEQYFEIFGNRAIYKDGWVAAAKRDYHPWRLLEDVGKIYMTDPSKDRWELYNVDADFSEATDLAAKDPAKLDALKAEFVREGSRNGVFPLLPIPLGAPLAMPAGQRQFVYGSRTGALSLNSMPELGVPHRFDVEIKGNAATGSGALIAYGGRLGGFVLYVKDGKLALESNVFGQERHTITSADLLPAGPATVSYEFVPDATGAHGPVGGLARPAPTGTARLFVNGKLAGEGPVGRFPTIAGSFSEGFDIGVDRGSPVSNDPVASRKYTGTLGDTKLQLK